MLSAGILRERTAFALVGLLVVALWLPRTQGPIDLRWDGGVYYVLGTSLAEGKGYRLLNEPGEIQANQYPPLFPMIIAAHQIVLGTSDYLVVGRLLRLSAFLVFSAYAFAILVLLRRYLSNALAFFGTVLCLLNAHTYIMSDACFPDLSYGLITVGFLLAYSNEKRGSTQGWAGAFAITAFALRTAGVALLAAWIGEGLVRRQWKIAVVRFAIAAIPIVGWFSYVHHVEMSEEYQQPAYAYQRADYLMYNVAYARNVSLKDPFDPELGYATLGDRVERFFHNAVQVPRYLGESVSWWKWWLQNLRWEIGKRTGFYPGSEWTVNVPWFVLAGLVLFGAGMLAAQGRFIVPLCVFSSISVMCLTPWPQEFLRYLMPTVPMLSLCLCTAIAWLLNRTERAASRKMSVWKGMVRVLVFSVIVWIGLGQIAQTLWIYATRHRPVQYQSRQGNAVTYRLFSYGEPYRAFDSAVDWLMGRAKPSDIIANALPHWVYLRTGTKSVMPPFESDPLKAEHLLESVPVAYLIVEEGLPMSRPCSRSMKAVIEKFPERWKRVYSDAVMTESGGRLEQALEIYQRVHP
jgi:hypothetical protein